MLRRAYYLNEILDFGIHKGEILSNVIETDPIYILKLLEKNPIFKMNTYAHNKLKKILEIYRQEELQYIE